MKTRSVDERKAIDQYSLGTFYIIDQNAAKEVLKRTELPLNRKVQEWQSILCINQVVNETVHAMLTNEMSRREFEKLHDAFKMFEEISLQLQLKRDFPELTPRDWHLRTKEWLGKVSESFENKLNCPCVNGIRPWQTKDRQWNQKRKLKPCLGRGLTQRDVCFVPIWWWS